MKISFMKLVMVVFFISMMLTGCSEKNIDTKLIVSGMDAVENMEYDRAMELFKRAKEEKAKKNESIDESIDILIEIISDYKEAVRNYNAKNYDRAKEILDNIDDSYVNYKIKDDIDYLLDLIKNNH